MGVRVERGLTRIPIARRADRAERLERAERLRVDERTAGQRRREVGIGLADPVDDDPFRAMPPARSASASSTGPTTSKPMPVDGEPAQERRIGVGLDRVGDERAGRRASRHARARPAARSRSVT